MSADKREPGERLVLGHEFMSHSQANAVRYVPRDECDCADECHAGGCRQPFAAHYAPAEAAIIDLMQALKESLAQRAPAERQASDLPPDRNIEEDCADWFAAAPPPLPPCKLGHEAHLDQQRFSLPLGIQYSVECDGEDDAGNCWRGPWRSTPALASAAWREVMG